MDDPVVTEKSEDPSHVGGVTKGEDVVKEEGKEPGRQDTGTDGTPANRPTGTSDPRDMTSIDPAGGGKSA